MINPLVLNIYIYFLEQIFLAATVVCHFIEAIKFVNSICFLCVLSALFCFSKAETFLVFNCLLSTLGHKLISTGSWFILHYLTYLFHHGIYSKFVVLIQKPVLNWLHYCFFLNYGMRKYEFTVQYMLQGTNFTALQRGCCYPTSTAQGLRFLHLFSPTCKPSKGEARPSNCSLLLEDS